MDGLLDDFFSKLSTKWECPECRKEGRSAEVKIYQASSDTAVFFCETNGCLYPYTGDPEMFFVERGLSNIPVNEKMLTRANLPHELLDSGELKVNQLGDLVWLNNFLPRLDDALESLQSWQRFIGEIEPNKKVSQCLQEVKDLKDPDIDRLVATSDDVLEFAKHLRPDIKEIVSNIKSTFY